VARGVSSAHPLFAVKARGGRLWDADGNEYLDFASGIGVLAVGHNHPRYLEAVRAQLGQFSHTCFQVVMYEGYVELARRLSLATGGSRPNKAFFATTGAEAVENAIKIARTASGRAAVVAFQGGFHGRTLLGITLTGMSRPYRQAFGPFAPEIYHAPYPYEYRGWNTELALRGLDELFATIVAPDRIAAFLIEPQLGDGGFVPAPFEYLRALREVANRHGILLICDEIQTGFGRTGEMFAYQHSGIEPDLVVIGKSLAGGMPLAGVVGRAEIMDGPEPGGLGGTYAGNPVACAGALAVLDIIEEEGLVARARNLGSVLHEELAGIAKATPAVGDLRGLGTMLAIEFVRDIDSKSPDPELVSRVIDNARSRGLLVIGCGIHRNVLRLLPPLTISDSEAIDGAQRLAAAITDAARARQ
jgi:4-aminobutyrate aminotransferase/(S)-3-amino-2-methylpropionate transaminase